MSMHEDEAQCEATELHIRKLEAALEAERAKVARLREALLLIELYRNEHSEQRAHVAWHIIQIDIPSIVDSALDAVGAPS